MDKVYFVLLTVAAVLLLFDAFLGVRDRRPGQNWHVRLLPLALFFWVLVPWLQTARAF